MSEATAPVTIVETPESVELLPLEQIMRKEASFLGQDIPENKVVFDGLLVKHLATRMVAAISSWQDIGRALSYMVKNEIPQRLGYDSIEKWIQESLRPQLAKYACEDKGVQALLQWRNYWDVFEYIAEVEPLAGKNLIDAQAGPAYYRSVLSWASNPQKKLPGINIETSEDLKTELIEVAAQAIRSIGVEEPDPDSKLPPGKNLCDVAKSLRSSALLKMQNEATAAIAKRLAQDVDDNLIQVHRFYELLGAYEYCLTETVECPRTGEATQKTRKVTFDFKEDSESESDRWVEIMAYDPEEKEVFIRPWIHFGIPLDERDKRDMDKDGVLKKAVSVCALNLKDESRIALTKEELDNQPISVNIMVDISHKDWEILKKSHRNMGETALGDKVADNLRKEAVEMVKKKDELSAKKNAEAEQGVT